MGSGEIDAGEVEHDLVLAERSELHPVGYVVAGDHDHLAPGERRLEIGLDQLGDMRQHIHDVCAVAALHPGAVQLLVEDAHRAALADNARDQLDIRRLPHILCARLEGEPEETEALRPLSQYPVEAAMNENAV